MTNLQPSPYLTPEEAGAYLRLEPQTLNNMRWKGLGPNYRKHGGKVLYHRDELDAWHMRPNEREAFHRAFAKRFG